MNRKDYEFAKKAARTAYQQALLDAEVGEGGLVNHSHDYNGNIIDGGDFTPHNHLGVYAPYDHKHDEFAGKEEFDALQAQVEEHLTNHPEGGETPEPEPEEPHWEVSSRNRFVRGKDGARWDNGGDGVSSSAWLPAVDADGETFQPESPIYEVKVEDENLNRSSWSNHKSTAYAENGVDGFLITMDAWGELEGEQLLYDATRKWVKP